GQFFVFQAEDGIRDFHVTGVQTCALPILKDFEILGGKELSFNNLRDMDLCWKVVNEFKGEMACCAVKHSTPCGVAVGTSALETRSEERRVGKEWSARWSRGDDTGRVGARE